MAVPYFLSTSLQFNPSEPFQQFERHRPIIFHEEHVLTIVAALRYVMSDHTYNDSRYPRHDKILTSTRNRCGLPLILIQPPLSTHSGAR